MSSKSKMLNDKSKKALKKEALMQRRKEIFILKLIMLICAVIVITLVVLFLFDLEDGNINYFNQHFLLSICLFSIGIIAMILPNVTKTKFSDQKGDKMMPLIGIMLIVCALLSIFLSYTSIF